MDSSLEFPRVEKNTYAERVKMQRILLAKEFARCTTVIPRGKNKQTNKYGVPCVYHNGAGHEQKLNEASKIRATTNTTPKMSAI